MGKINYSDTIGQFLFCLFGFITRRIELDKTIKIYIAFYYLSDAIGHFLSKLNVKLKAMGNKLFSLS